MTHTFLAKAHWQATAKTFLVVARDEQHALEKAERSKEARGAVTVLILKQLS